MLSRSLGHELIVSVGQFSMPLVKGDRLLLCSDGLYNVLEEREFERLLRSGDAAAACKALIEAANARQRRQPDRRGLHDERRDAVRRDWRRRRAMARVAGEAFCAAALSRDRARRGPPIALRAPLGQC